MSTLTIVILSAIVALFVLGLYIVLSDKESERQKRAEQQPMRDMVTPPMVTVTNSSINITFDNIPQDIEEHYLPPIEVPDDMEIRSDYDIFCDKDSSDRELHRAITSLINEGYTFYDKNGEPVSENEIPDFVSKIQKNRKALKGRTTTTSSDGIDVRNREADEHFDMTGINHPVKENEDYDADASDENNEDVRQEVNEFEVESQVKDIEPKNKQTEAAPVTSSKEPTGLTELTEQFKQIKRRKE